MCRSKCALLSLCLFALMFAPSCQRRSSAVDEAPEVTLTVEISPSPAHTGPGTLLVALKSPDGTPLAGVRLEGRGDMSHAGMIPIQYSFEETAPGAYRAAVEWTMAGDWILQFRGVLTDGRTLLRTVNLHVSPNGSEMDHGEG